MTTTDDEAAPLLPHEISAATASPVLPTTPPRRAKQLLLLPKTTSYGQTPTPSPSPSPPPPPLVSPAVPGVFYHPSCGQQAQQQQQRPSSPLEPFPAFDPSVGPPPESLYYYHSLPAIHNLRIHDDEENTPTSPTRTQRQEQHQRDQKEQVERVKNHSSNNSPHTGPTPTNELQLLFPLDDKGLDRVVADTFVPSVVRYHTLTALAEQVLLRPPKGSNTGSNKATALAYLDEARGVLAWLEQSRVLGCQTGRLWRRLSTLEEMRIKSGGERE